MMLRILVVVFLFAPSVMADTAKPLAEEFLDAEPNTSNVNEMMRDLFGAEAARHNIREQELRRSERDLQLREDEYKQERLRRDGESRERAKARFDQGLRDAYRPPIKTDCSTDLMGGIYCTTR